jgi:hypothetical protein
MAGKCVINLYVHSAEYEYECARSLANMLLRFIALYALLQAEEASEEGASPLPLSGRQCALLMRQLWQLSTSSSSSSSSTTAAAAAAAALQLEPRALATIAEDSALSGTASDDLLCELQLYRRLSELQHWQVDTPQVLTSASDVVPGSVQSATTTAAAVAAAVAAAGGSSRGSGSGTAKRSIGGLGGISESANGSSSDAAAADESDDGAAVEREQAIKLQLARHYSGNSSSNSSGADSGDVVYVKLRPVRYASKAPVYSAYYYCVSICMHSSYRWLCFTDAAVTSLGCQYCLISCDNSLSRAFLRCTSS